MQKRTYTAEEQEQLRTNPNVVRCTKHMIIYEPDFKRAALRAYYEDGKDARTIFAEAGFPASVVKTLTPKWAITQWRKTYGPGYEQADMTNKRGKAKKGGRPRTERVDVAQMTDKEKITYYEARVAYQEAENDFLARTQGRKRWPAFIWHQDNDSH
jgi:transposase